jgi:integrase
VNLELRHAWVRGTHSKNRRPIAVPLNDTAIKVLQRQLGQHETNVFTYKGNPIKAANTKAWGNALKYAGITDFR